MKGLIVSKGDISRYINTKTPEQVAQYVGRALVVLFNNQERDEQRDNDVRHRNDIGFAACDGKRGCLGAKSYLKNRTLAEWQVEQWTRPDKKGYPYIAKYHRQLNEAALKKAARKYREAKHGEV